MNIFSYFLNEWLLLGALGAVVPVVIHLLHRSRYNVQSWGAMMFLQESVKARDKTIRLQQFLLLFVRAAFFMLLALALARPLLNPERVHRDPKTGAVQEQTSAITHVLIIDASYSLQYGDHRRSVFDEVRDTARHLVRRMSRQDNMLIIRAGDQPRPLFRSPSSDRDLLLKRIQTMRAGNEKADLPAAVKRAFHLLSASNNPKHRIYILTDKQRISWYDAGDARWQDFKTVRDLQKIKPVIYILPHSLKAPKANLQIRRMYSRFPIVDIYRQNHFIVEIHNHGEERKVRIDFYAGEKLEGEREVTLQPGINSVGFDCTFSKPGFQYVTARIPDDELRVDNTYTLALKVAKQIPVLIIEGTSSQNPFIADSGFLKMALRAAVSDADDALLTTTVRNQTDLDRLDSAYLAKFKSIVLVNVSSISSYFRARLERFVSHGGGLLVGLGPGVNMSNYNGMFKENEGLLPGLLTGISPEQVPPLRPTYHGGGSVPMLGNLDLGRSNVLESVRVRRFAFVRPASEAEILASFDGHPFLLHKPFGKGQVVMWTTSLNAAWTNLPATPRFLPLTQNIVIFLSSRIRPPINLKLGEPLLFAASLPNVERGDFAMMESAEIVLPDGSVKRMPLRFDDGQWIGQYDDTWLPGLYSVRVLGQIHSYYAVHLNPEEGDLTPLSAQESQSVAEMLNGTYAVSVKKLDALMERETQALELWRHLIIAAVVLLMAELFLGWKFS